MVRNILNTLAIDKDDDYDIKSISLSGVKDILDKTQTMLSAVSEIPVTILFGRFTGGQNATGDMILNNIILWFKNYNYI